MKNYDEARPQPTDNQRHYQAARLLLANDLPLPVSPTQAGEFQTLQIDYVYDPLHRLAEASDSDGGYSHYTYDAAGNRLSETTPLGSTAFEYDAANRLIRAGGVSYTWDNNGNLTGVGTSTAYSYDHANRLKTMTRGADTYSFGYNGQGDRTSQTVNGATTAYLLDLNANLTQVLADGTNTYLYGLERIAQYAGAEPQYFLGDALGSVRQLLDASGTRSLYQSFDPFGKLSSRYGAGRSSYGYAGEWSDPSGLQYLRARYYAPAQGRFLTRDTWPGTPWQPASLNGFVYGNNNPVNSTDPSGHFAIPAMLIAGGIGALVGGTAGGAIYYATNQQKFDQTEFWVAVGGGAAAGAFVGSGLGILSAATTTVAAATTATAMVSGGSSAAITEAMYMAEN